MIRRRNVLRESIIQWGRWYQGSQQENVGRDNLIRRRNGIKRAENIEAGHFMEVNKCNWTENNALIQNIMK